MTKGIKKTKSQTMIYKTLNRNLNIEPHEAHEAPWVNSGTLGGNAVYIIIVAPFTNG